MGSHTPGPWESDGRIEGWWAGEQPAVRVTYCKEAHNGGSLHAPVAMCDPRVGEDEAIANARLIAAAPDLLLACRRMVDRLGTFGSLHESLTDEAAEAIQKATGGTE